MRRDLEREERAEHEERIEGGDRAGETVRCVNMQGTGHAGQGRDRAQDRGRVSRHNIVRYIIV